MYCAATATSPLPLELLPQGDIALYVLCCNFSFHFTDFEESSAIALEGAVYTSEGEIFFSPLSIFSFSLVKLRSVLPRTFPVEALPDFPLRFEFSSTLWREAAPSSLRREFNSKHYVLGGNVEVPILQSILWPFHQDKVLPTTTLSDQSTIED